jgi:hypothetical protein
MSTIPTPPTPHRTWCDESECTTRPGGQVVHRSAGAVFDLNENQVWMASMLTIALVETDNGIEVGFDVMGAIVRSSATLIPEVAAELGADRPTPVLSCVELGS